MSALPRGARLLDSNMWDNVVEIGVTAPFEDGQVRLPCTSCQRGSAAGCAD